MGRLLGWQLTQRGHDVHLYERDAQDQAHSAAHVAAAMLAPWAELPDSDRWVFDTGYRNLAIWAKWLTELNVAHRFEGSLVVAHRQDHALLTKFKRVINRIDPSIDYLSSHQIGTLEPGLEHFVSGLLLPDEGWLDNRALLGALESRCGTIHFSHPVQPEALRAEMRIDCRGVGAEDHALRAVRGEILRVHAPEVDLRRPVRLMHPRYQLYISPRGEHHYVIGATQVESHADHGVTIKSALELLSAAYSLHSGFAEAEITELAVGLRPAYPDNLPRVFWRDDVMRVNGLYRHGYLLAPELVMQVLQHVESTCKSTSTATP